MANLNPVPGRLAKRAKRATGDIAKLQRKLWNAVVRIETIMMTGGDDVLTLRAANALSQVAMTFLKASEVGELEARLEALERRHVA